MLTLDKLGLGRFIDNPQYNKYLDLLNAFVEQKSKEADVTHILVGGSFIRGQLEQGSDLDCYVLDTKMETLLEKGVIMDGVKVDYLTMNEDVLRKHIENEQNGNFRLFSQGFMIVKCIFGDDSKNKYIEFAKNVAESEILIVPLETLLSNINFLNNQKTETLRMLNKGDTIGFLLRVSHVAQNCVFFWFDANQVLAVPWKKLSRSVEDKNLLSHVEDVLSTSNNNEKHKHLCKLIDYTTDLLQEAISNTE
ncbi:MAG: hypothetical protein GPJ54_14005 [Candidatus Heimdallarchaeota archaeon]|nr:hypothetical protein [Candidatus Heimdallarchaeota archaeon]